MKPFLLAVGIQLGLLAVFILCPPLLIAFIVLLCFGNFRDAIREWF